MYDVLDDPTIENLVPAAVKMTKYIHDTKTGLVVVGGSSAQNAAYMVKQIWQKLYPQEKMPHFVATGMVMVKKKVAVLKEGNKSYFDDNIFDHVFKEKSKQEGTKVTQFTSPRRIINTSQYSNEEIQKMLKERIKQIDPNKNVFLLEEYAVSGSTISVMKNALSKLGFSRVRTGVLALDSHLTPSRVNEFGVNFVGVQVSTIPRVLYGARREQIQSLINYRLSAKDEVSQRMKKVFTKAHLNELKNTRSRIRTAVRR